MKKVGILVGREQTFPESMIKSINEKSGGQVVAEMVKVGGIRLDQPLQYDVIIDRISHEVHYYRAMLKRMALEGTYIINNPFWWSADDKFFNFSLGEAGRRYTQDGAASAGEIHQGHHAGEPQESRIPARLARNCRARRLPRISETV